MGKIVFIYTLSEPNTGEVKYIGKTINVNNRLRGHLSEYKKRESYKNNWIKSLLKQGLKPKLDIIDEVQENEWPYWEQYWISQFKTWGFKLTNTTEGGESGPVLFGSKKPCFGKKRDDKTIFKIKNTFKQKSDFEKEELRARISNNNSKPIIQYSKNMDYMKDWKSSSQDSKKLNINISHISETCRGERKSAGGYV